MIESLGPLFRELERLRIPYAVVGSFASSSWGHPRHTNDLDVVMALDVSSAKALVDALSDDFLADLQSIENSLESTDPFRSFTMVSKATNFSIDVFIPPLDDYNYAVIKRAEKVEIIPGVFMRCESAEDLIIGKLRWYELGRRESDRQWNDIVQVIGVRSQFLDQAYIREWVSRFDLTELFESAWNQASHDRI